MKNLVLIIVLLSSQILHAQNRNEWFEQKKTQKKYLLQQIVALKVYLGYLEKGYDIASKGLNTIHDIKKGDFNLHNNFFNSLKQVNPKIQKSAKVADILAYQVRIVKIAKQNIERINENGQFTNEELDYCKIVFDNLLTECLKNIDELVMMITSGEVEMKDDERIKRIDQLYVDMQDKYSFNCSFGNDINLLSLQRMNEQSEINHSRLIYSK
jgi:hypothetical protein